MDQNEYNRRAFAALAHDSPIRVKAHSTAPDSFAKPSTDAAAVERAMRDAGIDPDSDAAEPLWDVWVQYGLKAAQQQIAASSGAWLTDSGKPLLWRDK